MKGSIRNKQRVWHARAGFAAALLIAAWTAQACDIDRDGLGTNAFNDWTYRGVGQPLTDWAELGGAAAQTNIYLYRNCTPGSAYTITLFANTAVWSDSAPGGGAIFDLSTPSTSTVGVQFRVSDGGGSVHTAEPVTSSGVKLSLSAGNQYLRARIWYRYVAIEDVSSQSTLVAAGYNWGFDNETQPDLSSYKFVNSQSFDRYVTPYCSFTSLPVKAVELPLTTRGMLEKNGEGSATEFSWRYACGGTRPNGATVSYTPGTSTTDPASGRMAIQSGDGSAEGVELAVRRGTSPTGRKENLQFNRNFLLGTSGVEYLDVRYVRGSGTLKVGEANGSLTVHLDVR
ncbi:hypothetical protein [Stenotrophomonas maltophilia]|uniref:hypothetical protein n=1 Tax=Stenotrophomonas maltophilia TaxID=40324 RepID=UPI00115D1061|nr:hypothetical protein [Stenotrophomonas maltophilia]